MLFSKLPKYRWLEKVAHGVKLVSEALLTDRGFPYKIVPIVGRDRVSRIGQQPFPTLKGSREDARKQVREVMAPENLIS